MMMRGRTATGALVVMKVGDDGSLVVDGLDELLALGHAPLGPWADHTAIAVAVEPATATQLPDVPCQEIVLIADHANSQMIYVGGANVASTKSLNLEPSEVRTIHRVSNASQVWVVAAATHTGQKLRYQTR